jgi:hypothetical protein
MGMALERKTLDDRSRGPHDGRTGASSELDPKDLLEQAHGLAAQIEGLLTEVGHEVAESDNFRVRLARAHTLSLLDQLAELLQPRSSVPPPTVRSCGARDEDSTAASAVKPGSRAMFAR